MMATYAVVCSWPWWPRWIQSNLRLLRVEKKAACTRNYAIRKAVTRTTHELKQTLQLYNGQNQGGFKSTTKAVTERRVVINPTASKKSLVALQAH